MALFRRRRGPIDPADRVPRKDRQGMSAVKVGLIAAVIVAIGVYFGFAKDIPFTEGYRLRAVFETSNQIRLNSPVRIAGVNVGKVKSIERQEDTGAAIVVMEIQDKGLPIHKDAEVKIRPRIFLEGNFFVDLKPGTPAAPTLDDGDTLPITQTATPGAVRPDPQHAAAGHAQEPARHAAGPGRRPGAQAVGRRRS